VLGRGVQRLRLVVDGRACDLVLWHGLGNGHRAQRRGVLALDRAKARIGGHSVALICHDAPLPAAGKPDEVPLKVNSNVAKTTIKVTPALS